MLGPMEACARAEFGEFAACARHRSSSPLPRGKYSDLFARPAICRTRDAGDRVDRADPRFLWLQRLGAHASCRPWVFAGAVACVVVRNDHRRGVRSALISALISDRWERKWSIAVVALADRIVRAFLRHDIRDRLHRDISVFWWRCSPQTFAPLLYAYTPECYPTHIRNSGSGLGYGVGRLANVSGPLIVAFLFNHYGYKSVFVYVAAMWVLVAAIVGAFGPSTKAQALA